MYAVLEITLFESFLLSYFKVILRSKREHPGSGGAHPFNSSTLEAGTDRSLEFKASLVHITSTRTARDEQRNRVSKNKIEKTKPKNSKCNFKT